MYSCLNISANGKFLINIPKLKTEQPLESSIFSKDRQSVKHIILLLCD